MLYILFYSQRMREACKKGEGKRFSVRTGFWFAQLIFIGLTDMISF